MQPDSSSTLPRIADLARWRWLGAIAVLASAAVYAGSWTGGIVWDDHYLIDGSAIGGGRSVWDCITVPFMSHYFRPLVSLDFFFERKLWHDHALGYRLVSSALHALATGILMGLLRDALHSRRAAFLGALFFAVQPVQVGAVAWIGGRTDALCEVWLLLFLRCVVIAAQRIERRGPLLAWAVIWYLLALFTKEQSIALLPLVPAAFACWGPRDGENLPRTPWVMTIPFVIVSALFLALGWYLGMPRPLPMGLTPGEQFFQAGRILGYYAIALAAPTPSVMHLLSLGPFEHAGAAAVLFGYAAFAASIGLLAVLWRRDRAAAWFLSLVLLSILPVSGFLPLPFLLVAPYRAAIGGIGVAALMGICFSRAWVGLSGSPSVFSRVAAAACAALLALHVSLTAWGAVQWRDEVTLFERIIRSDPEAVVPPYVIAYMYNARGNTYDAARMCEATLQNVFRSDAWKTRETAVRALRDDRRVLQRARQNQGQVGDPHIWLAGVYNDLGQLYLHLGQPRAALLTYQIGDAVYDRNPDIISGIGYCFAQQGNDAAAVQQMRKALAIDPDHHYSHEWLGRYYSRIGQWEEADRELATWVKLVPDSVEAQTMLRDARTQLERRRALQTGTMFSR